MQVVLRQTDDMPAMTREPAFSLDVAVPLFLVNAMMIAFVLDVDSGRPVGEVEDSDEGSRFCANFDLHLGLRKTSFHQRETHE